MQKDELCVNFYTRVRNTKQNQTDTILSQKANGYKDFVSADGPHIGFNVGQFDVTLLVSLGSNVLEVRYKDDSGTSHNILYDLGTPKSRK